jgi:hypothetical protein
LLLLSSSFPEGIHLSIYFSPLVRISTKISLTETSPHRIIFYIKDEDLVQSEDFNSSMDTSVTTLDSTPVASKKNNKSLPLPTPAAKKEDAKTPKSVKKVVAASDSVKKAATTTKVETPKPAEPVSESKVKKAAPEKTVTPVPKPATDRKSKAVAAAAAETVASPAAGTPGRPGRGEKRKPEEESSAASPVKKAARGGEAAATPKDNGAAAAVESGEKVSRSGRLIKPKKFDDDAAASSPNRSTDTDSEVP